jgi:hypothetical protein
MTTSPCDTLDLAPTSAIVQRASLRALLWSWLQALVDACLSPIVCSTAWGSASARPDEGSVTASSSSVAFHHDVRAFEPVFDLAQRIGPLVDCSTTNAGRTFCDAALALVQQVRSHADTQPAAALAQQLLVGLRALLDTWMAQTDDLFEWLALREVLGLSVAPLPERFAPALPVAPVNEWEALAEQLLAQDEPDEALVDRLVDDGMAQDPERARAAVCRLLEQTSNPALCYELCHALLNFEVPIHAQFAQAVRPLLHHSSNRVFMAGLHVLLKQDAQRGVREWESIRETLGRERCLLGDELVAHISAGQR